MRIPTARHHRAPQVPTVPMADVAFLLVVLFAAGAMFSAAKGIGMRFAEGPDAVLAPAGEATVWVKVASDGSLRVDGRPIPYASLVETVTPRLVDRPGATLVLFADPATEFGAFVSAYDAIAGARQDGPLAGVRVALPTRRQVESYVAVSGRDPFEARP